VAHAAPLAWHAAPCRLCGSQQRFNLLGKTSFIICGCAIVILVAIRDRGQPPRLRPDGQELFNKGHSPPSLAAVAMLGDRSTAFPVHWVPHPDIVPNKYAKLDLLPYGQHFAVGGMPMCPTQTQLLPNPHSAFSRKYLGMCSNSYATFTCCMRLRSQRHTSFIAAHFTSSPQQSLVLQHCLLG
jgi:hypothetical protein